MPNLGILIPKLGIIKPIFGAFGISETELTVAAYPGTISIIPKFRVAGGTLETNSRYSETLVNSLPDLGRVVREQRRASGLRIDDAAALCGVSVDLLSRLENGHSGVGSARLLKVLDGLGLAIMVVDKSRLTGMPATDQSTR